ncbi:bifunctional oligoribonuclease/PAP phosphatase NrnA [Paenibacillus athensensis]|uniref:DHH family phosphoesterase n=1 Tax=Paenibacillus athensensis TaxID=1967502 RepID=A0A4Y8QAQ0_9BACL|nr:bifunctional oligoribonuclease/PAP phosphatase NrnA [Paenibacillus athensensis]MCD1257773.1 bifunctional oligoribonuclease/PAP phosphatase NrnA [Paenibacillus athensensis]
MIQAADYKQQLETAAAFIREHNEFLVVAHIQPDGDAAGSTYGMGLLLKQLGKSFTMINEGPMPAKFDFLTGSADVVDFSAAAPSRLFGQAIVVDCSDFSRIGQVQSLLTADAQVLNLDHHATNDGFGTLQLVKPDAAAAVQIIYDLAMELGIEPTLEFGTCIYNGLLTDTGGFRYSNTTPQVMQLAASLLALGVNGAEIAERVLERLSYPQMALLQSALPTLAYAHDRRVAWLSVSLADLTATGASGEDLDGLVNYARNVEGVEVGMLFKEKAPGVIKISLRSAGLVDVAQLALSLGGGGHVRAAGCTLSGTLEEAAAKMVEEVGKLLP